MADPRPLVRGSASDLSVELFRIYTVVAAEQFGTLVLESDWATLGDMQEYEVKIMGDDRAKSIMAGYHDLVTQGRREIYKVES